MRQYLALRDAIYMRTGKEEYYHMSFHAKISGVKEFPSLEEFLGVPLDEETPLDPELDKKMDEMAKALLAERKAMRNV